VCNDTDRSSVARPDDPVFERQRRQAEPSRPSAIHIYVGDVAQIKREVVTSRNEEEWPWRERRVDQASRREHEDAVRLEHSRYFESADSHNDDFVRRERWLVELEENLRDVHRRPRVLTTPR